MTGTADLPDSLLREGSAAMSPLGPIGRLGYWMAGHVRVVVVAWAVIAVGLGVFAPRAEHAISGNGVSVSLTGAPGMWSDFNEASKSAMMKSELLAWPISDRT